MPTDLDIAKITDVTPEWVTSMLHRNGIRTRAEVSALRVILSKELPVSTVHRLALEYSDKKDDAGRPTTLFLKLSAPGRSGFESGDLDRPEVEFYNELAPGIGCPPLIRCYDAAFDAETSRSHLLLEDLTETHTQPRQNTAPPEEMSRLAVAALAKVHAPFWSSPELENGKAFTSEWLSAFVENLRKNVAEFSKVAELTEKQKDAYQKMLKAASRIWGRLTDPNGLTVTHGDVHWWNFLYPNDAEVDSVRLFDWQLWHVDLGARDLAFLLALGGFAEPRPSIEEELLRVYHEELRVPGYSWEMLIEDYRWSVIRNLNIPVIFWKQGKHYTTWQDALRRAYDAYERLGCISLMVDC